MKAFLGRAAKWVLYPLFYVVCLFVFLYLSFPWDSLKNKLIAEFAKGQAAKGDKAWRLEIDKIDGYWFSGVQVEGVRIIMPPSDSDEEAKRKALQRAANDDMADAPDASPSPAKADDASPDKKDAKDANKESTLTIDSGHARVRLLPLLIGNVRIDFDAEAFGGDINGTIPLSGGTLTVDVKDVNLNQVDPIKDLVGVPVQGIANGHIEFTADGSGKWSKSTGGIDLKVDNVVLGDGNAKLLGKLTLPPAQLGTMEISGKATDGLLKFDKFGATGKDVDIIGAGYLKVRDPWDASQLDFIIRFAFADAYKVKDDKTKALFGDPAAPEFPGLLPTIFEADRRLKKGKRDDGFWGLRGTGALKRLKWDGTTDDAPAKPPGGGPDTVDSAAVTRPTAIVPSPPPSTKRKRGAPTAAPTFPAGLPTPPKALPTVDQATPPPPGTPNVPQQPPPDQPPQQPQQPQFPPQDNPPQQPPQQPPQ